MSAKRLAVAAATVLAVTLTGMAPPALALDNGLARTPQMGFNDWNAAGNLVPDDNCNNQGVSAQTRYTTMRDALAATGRPILFSLWAEMAAPLIAGTNIPNANATTVSILTNSRVIAVDQDPLGKQGRMVSSSSGRDVLAKPLAGGDVSVVLFNEGGSAATISTTAAAIGKTGAASYTLTDLWTGATSTTTSGISASVPGHGVVMYRVAG